MVKLSHIDDFPSDEGEKRQEPKPGRSVAAAPSAATGSSEALSAEQEAEFHGLDEKQPLGAGHAILIACAVIVVAIAIVYIVNSWIHFI